ncbi:MAG: type II secretion system secretin GspD [Halioglobus sp.]
MKTKRHSKLLGVSMWDKIAVVAALSLLSSCAALEERDRALSSGEASSGSVNTEKKIVDASAPLATSATALAKGEKAEDEPGDEAVIYRGNDKQVNIPAVQSPVRFVGDDVSLNFEQAPLSEVMHAIMGDILALDYIVDNPVSGQITLRTRTPIPRSELLGILESLLKTNGAIMIRGKEGRYLVTGSATGTKVAPNVSNARDTAAGYSTIIIPLQYISATNMAEILKPVADPGTFVRVDNSRNILMLAGTRAQLNGWLEMVNTFDVDLLAGMSVGLFPLKNSSVQEIEEALGAMLNDGSEGGGSIGQLIRVIPIDRLNSILIVTPRAHYLDTAQKWIERLDEAHYSAFDKRLYVYPVQNTEAGRLADLLNSIYAGGGGSSSASRGRDASVAPGMSPESVGSGGNTGNSRSAFSNTGSGSRGSQSGISAVTMAGDASLAGSENMLADVRVVSDDENNSLMIYANGMQYRLIEDALEQLDIVATQVIIEASIMEVSLTDELRYGLEWTFKNGLGSDYDGLGVLANAATGPAAVVPGFSYTVTNSIGDISAVLNALSEESLINVISSPSVMVLDNHEAYIHVGDQVPVFANQTVNTGGDSLTQSVEYRDTGVKLNVKPSVNAGGLVTMDIEQSVTDVGPIDPATGQRSFLEREISSRVAVRSNESVVLGGLIRENASDASSGIPFLHKLPLIGPLFGTVTKEDRRTELLVIITPRALYNETELREVSDQMRSQIRDMVLIKE